MSRGTISSVAVLACLLVNAAVSSPLRKAEHSTSHHASHHLTRADAKAAALQSRINEYDKRSGVERQLINRILKENKRTISKSDAEALNKFIASSQNILADIAKYSGPNLDAMEEVRESMLAKIKQIDTKLKERRLDLKKASSKTELNTKSNSTSLKASDKELNSAANKTAIASDAKVSKESSQTANNETKPAAAADRASKVLEDILTKFKKLEERVEKKGKERDLEDKKAKEEKEEKERKEKDDKEKDDKDKKEKDAAKEAEKNKERKISDKAKEESKVAANKKANEPLTPDDDSPRSAPTPSAGGGGGGPSQSMFNNGGGGGGLPTWNMQPQTQQMMGMTMTPDGRSDLISGYASQDANSLKQVGTSADRALDSLGNGFIDGGTLNGNMMSGQQQMMGGPTSMQQPMEGGMDQGMEQTQSFGPPSSQGAPSILGQSSENLGEQENFDQMQGGMEVAGGGAPEQFEDRGHDQGQTEEMYGGGEEIDEPHHHHHHHHGHHHRGHHHDDAEEAAQIAQQFLQPGDQGTGAAGYEMSQDTQQEPFMHDARGATTEVFDAGRGHGPSMGLLTGGGFVNSKSPSQLGAPQAHDSVPQFGAVMGAKTRAKTPAAVLSSQPNGAPPLLDRSRGISGFGGGQSMIQGKPAAFSLPPGAFMGPTQVDPADKLLADLQQKQLSSNEFEAMMNMNRQRMMSDGMSGFLPQSGQPGFPGSPGYGAPRGMEFTDPNMGRSMGQQISDVVGQAPGVARGMARSFGQGAPLPVAGIQTGMQPGYGPMFGPTIGMNPFGGSGMLGGKFKKDKVKKRANRRKKKRSRVARLSNQKQNKRSRVSRRKNKRGHIAKQHKRRHISRRQDKMDRDLVLIRSL